MNAIPLSPAAQRPKFSKRFILIGVFLFVVAVVAAVWGNMPGGGIKEKTALVLDLQGRIVEQRSGGLREKLLAQSGGDGADSQTQLRDVLAALELAAKDDKISSVYLATDDLAGAGMASLREIGAALTRFKASGKKVVAWGAAFDQKRYYLAAHADEFYLHPMGGVMLQGLGGYRNYYRAALDRLGIDANVIRSGKYKNFGEAYFANGPSAETKESDKVLLDGLWATYTEDIERVRKLPAGSIAKGIENLTARLTALKGDAAKLALEDKLITGIKTRDEVRAMMIERGALDTETKSFRQVSLSRYIAKNKPTTGGDAVAVVIAEGEIGDGVAPAGRIGGRSTAALIRKAREDSNIKAVVLRVNSPGGSAFGSELIRHELELTRTAGKPVVVSMGDVAASGGYWIAMSADEVIADAATVTGSIGVFGILPTGEKAMEKLSISTGGYGTTWLSEAMYDPRRALDPRMAELVKVSIDRIYSDFTTKAAAARKTTPEKIDEVAQGRVWTGAQAKERGLIDRVGSYRDALAAATTRAKLAEGAPVRYIERERSPLEQFLERLGGEAMIDIAKHFELNFMPVGVPANVTREMQRDMAWIASLADSAKTGLPFSVITHCLCGQ